MAATKLPPLEQRLRAFSPRAFKARSDKRRSCLICSGRIQRGEWMAHFTKHDLSTHWTCFNTESMRKGATW
jgi:hypothetical protein